MLMYRDARTHLKNEMLLDAILEIGKMQTIGSGSRDIRSDALHCAIDIR